MLTLFRTIFISLLLLTTLNIAQASALTNKSASFEPVEWGLSPDYNKLLIRNDTGKYIYVQIALSSGDDIHLTGKESTCDDLRLGYELNTRSAVCGLAGYRAITITYEGREYSAGGTYQVIMPDPLR